MAKFVAADCQGGDGELAQAVAFREDLTHPDDFRRRRAGDQMSIPGQRPEFGTQIRLVQSNCRGHTRQSSRVGHGTEADDYSLVVTKAKQGIAFRPKRPPQRKRNALRPDVAPGQPCRTAKSCQGRGVSPPESPNPVEV